MKETIARLAETAWQEHRGKLLGAGLGFILAVSILLFGFWRIAFIVLCVLAGLWIGVKVDRGEDILQNLRDSRFHEFHRWK